MIDRRWLLGGFGFLVATAYIPGISGLSTTGRWLALALGCWILMGEGPGLDWKKAGPILAAVSWILLTYFWSTQPLDGQLAAFHYFVIVSVALLGATVSDPRALYIGFAAGLISLAWPLDLFVPDINLLGDSAVCAFMAMLIVGYRSLRFSMVLGPLLLAAIIYSHSRSALLGLACGCMAGAMKLNRRWTIFALILSAAVLGIAIGLGQKVSTLDRFNIWHDTVAGLTWFGHGLGSYRTSVALYGGQIDVLKGMRPDHAHNDILEIAFESGLLGAALAVAAFGWLIWKSWGEREVIILIAGLGASLTTFQFHIPSTLFLAAFALGRLMRRDHLWGHDAVGRGPFPPLVARLEQASNA